MAGGLFGTMDIAASGMTAQRLRLDVIANNLANASTTRTPGGGPFRRQVPVFQERALPFWQVLARRWRQSIPEATPGPGAVPVGGGVRVAAVVADPSPPRLVYDPGHPDAGPDGYVAYPNVDPLVEMVNLLAATRAYEANVTVFAAARAMALRALEIGRG
ncbi:MAG: flagellar basal body rod protein FlgC [Symbiobacteriaceae bacterium]